MVHDLLALAVVKKRSAKIRSWCHSQVHSFEIASSGTCACFHANDEDEIENEVMISCPRRQEIFFELSFLHF